VKVKRLVAWCPRLNLRLVDGHVTDDQIADDDFTDNLTKVPATRDDLVVEVRILEMHKNAFLPRLHAGARPVRAGSLVVLRGG
jgi:hypothetical protein